MFAKRFVTALLCAVLAAPVVMARGQSGSSSSGTGSSGSQPRGTLPLTTGNVTFTVLKGIGGNVNSLDYRDNLFTKKIVDETGIKLDFSSSPTSDFTTRLSAMLNTGTYPELLIQGIDWRDLPYYADQGIVIPLDQYDPMSYPNIKAAFDEYPWLNDILRGPSGELLALPSINDCLHCVYSSGRAWYFMPWMRDKYGGMDKVPQSIDELDAYLRWIKANDVNGNGDRNDEIPMAFSELNSAVGYIAKSYLPWNSDGLALRNGRVWEQYKENEFRQALTVLAGWYKDGLIAPNSLSMTRDDLQALTTATPAIVGIIPGTWSNSFTQQPSDRWIDTFQMPQLKGPTGQRWAANNAPWGIGGVGMVITDKCKDPALALAWYDYMLRFEVMMDGYIGPRGTAWTDPDPGAKGLNGEDARYKLLTTFHGQTANISWEQGNPMIRNSAFRLSEQATDSDKAERWLATGDPSLKESLLTNNSYNEQMNYRLARAQMEWTIPQEYFIPPTADAQMTDLDRNRVVDIKAILNPQKSLAWAEFIAGIRNINDNVEWNAYLADLDRMGSSEMAAIYQKYIK
jgi:putative aldouronate transport system substrate-binding protein